MSRPGKPVEPLVTRAQLAEILSMSEDTVDELRKAGMPAIRYGRRLVRFQAREAVAWVKKHYREGV